MPSLGPAEILVILVIALLVFGPTKMPDIARQVGRGVREFRRVQQHLTGELRDVVSEFDTSSADDTPDIAQASDLGLRVDGMTPAAGGDPVPTLPPRFDAPEPQPAQRPAPAPSTNHDEADRGQRVWPPPPTADA